MKAKVVNFMEVNMSTAVLYGLREGEFALSTINGVATMALRIPTQCRKGGASAFTANIQESVEYDAFYLETGFYPVKKDGKTVLAFYYNGKFNIISRVYARDVRLSGGIIDLDEGLFRKEVMKHLNHIEREMRKLCKDQKGAKVPTSDIDEDVDRLMKDRPNLDRLLAEMRATSGK